MAEQHAIIINTAMNLASLTACHKVFLFLNSKQDCRWLIKSDLPIRHNIIVILPRELEMSDSEIKKSGLEVIRSWAGTQSRFSRIKYAFLRAVVMGAINTDSKIVCVLGPSNKSHLDTITVHDLSLSWSDDFPFDPRAMASRDLFSTVMAVVDIALDIGAVGREGKNVGTTFVIGDKQQILKSSRQAVFNPFRGYPQKERLITRPEVVESIKELSLLDGAFIISGTGHVEAAGRHLNSISPVTKQLRGLGSRHRAAAGITRKTDAVAVVVSESTGRVTIFEKGRIVSTLEPELNRRI